jgi:2-C-methyl-D-erythritol 4-phosphate cytidylyltransferase
MKVAGVVVAAGRGIRAGGELPKQYETVENTHMLTLTVAALLKSKKIEAIVVVINPLDIDLYINSIKNITDKRLLPYCLGGNERSESVRLGLKALTKCNPKKVLIHDAARPYITTKTINKVLKSLDRNAAVLPVLPIFDAIWERQKLTYKTGNIIPGPNRNNLYRAQTPQGFDYSTICLAYTKSNKNTLDDISIAYEAGVPISTVLGDENNYKITSAAQLKKFKGII